MIIINTTKIKNQKFVIKSSLCRNYWPTRNHSIDNPSSSAESHIGVSSTALHRKTPMVGPDVDHTMTIVTVCEHGVREDDDAHRLARTLEQVFLSAINLM